MTGTQHKKATAISRQGSLPFRTSNYVVTATVAHAIQRGRLSRSVMNNVVTMSEVLHLAQDDLLNYYSKM